MLRDRAARTPNAEFLRTDSAALDFATADERTDRLAAGLAELGVRPGDRVGLRLPNGLDYPLLWLAAAKLGAVVVPTSTQYREHDLRYLLTDARPTLVVTTADDVAACAHAMPEDLVCRVVDVTTVAAAGKTAAPSSDADVGPDMLMNIQYTSGTTGFPKGAMLSHDYWLRLGSTAADLGRLTPADVMLTAQPCYYLDPHWLTVAAIVSGSSLVILPRFSASTFWAAVVQHGATFLYVLGTMPVLLMKQPPSTEDREHRLRLVICSGIPPNMHAQFEDRWGVPWREAFGMTETGVDLVVDVDDTSSVGSGTVGLPVAGKDVRVVDDHDVDVTPDAVGELVIRGAPMMTGYWNNPTATADALRGGWFHTGDLVRRDERGRVYIVGRKKDMIRRGGENISAAEVEAVLSEHPAVQTVAVIAVADDIRGEEAKALVVPASDDLDPASLVEFGRQRLAPFKVPRYVELVDRLPLTPSERVAKHLLSTDVGTAVYDSDSTRQQGAR